MQGSFEFYDRQAVLTSYGMAISTNQELVESAVFKRVVRHFLTHLKEQDSPLLEIFDSFPADECYDKVYSLLVLLAGHGKDEILRSHPEYTPCFSDIYMLNQFVEELYNYWRSHERFLVLISPDNGKEQHHIRPYRAFNATVEQLNHIVRGTYRDICENITGTHPRVYRRLPAGFQVGVIAKRSGQEFPEGYGFLKDSYCIRQILMQPPLIIDPPLNKRDGEFRAAPANPIEKLEFEPKSWLCFPAQVGELIIHIYFNHAFMALGTALGNLFELADDAQLSKKPDAIYFFGVNDGCTKEAVFYDDQKAGLMTAFAPLHHQFGYFGYLKKLVLTLHNIIMMKRGRLPVHGAMVCISPKSGISCNVLLVGDSGAGKSESLEAFRLLSKKYLRSMTVIFDDMGSILLDNGHVRGFGTETGAFVRLDDLQPGFAYGNLDRSIVMSPQKINARAVLPITTIHEVLAGHPIDMILYANNYETDGPVLEFFKEWETAFGVFKNGERLAKGTTTEVGLTSTYFANPFGPPAYRELHEQLARRYFKGFFERGVKVGQIRTELGIKGMEWKGPEEAAKQLFELIQAGSSVAGR